MDNLPVFEFLVDDTSESGVKAVSIVSDPAFGSKFVTFGEESPKPKFVALEKKKRICAGLSLIPNVLVYRKDETFGEYYGYFTAATIEKIVEKYHEEMNSNKVNLDHNENMYIDAFMVEDFIVNSESRVEDLKNLGIEHENIMGAWYTSFKIKDEMAFEAILKNQESGASTGFSVEAYLNKIIVSMMNNENKKLQVKMKNDKKNILEKIVALFKDDKFERMLVPELAIEIEWDGVGSPVNAVTVDEEGNETLAPVGAGEFVTEAGIIVVDDASNLVEVREIPVEDPVVEEPMVDEPIVEVPVDEVPIDEIPVEEPVVEVPVEEPVVEEPVVPVEEVKAITIGEVVGDQDGEYYIKVKVEGGMVTEAEVSSDMDLMKDKLSAITLEKEEAEAKLKEPIGDPQLAPVKLPKKEFKDMNAYEKTMYKRNLEK